MSEIRVWSGVTIDGGQNKVTFTLIRMDNETPKAYFQRCQAIADLALSFVPKSKPEVFDFDNPSKFRKVGESSYEMITPGYQSTEEAGTERDSHFANFAAMLFDELHTLYLADTADETDPEHEAAKARYEHLDKLLIAQRAYDLAVHILEQFEQGQEISDLTEWPNTSRS